MTDDIDRDRGILTTADREFLKAEPGEFTRQAAHARRREIRKRTENAIKDFTVLFDELPDEEYTEIFGDLSSGELRPGVRDALSFFYHATAEPNFRNSISDNKPPHRLQGSGEFDQILGEAYRFALMKHNFLIESWDPPTAEGELIDGIGDVVDRAEEGGELSPGEVYMLLLSGVVDSDTVQSTVREELLENLPSDSQPESSGEADRPDPDREQ